MYAFRSLGESANFVRSEDGTGVITGLPVFRPGTFNDSRGKEVTYTSKDMGAMVEHFDLLRDDFPNPPVREDHSRSINSVVGYVDSLNVRSDGVLVADFTLTEPRAVDRWERKTYRGRSSEIGAWRIDEDTVKAPFFMGFAFVDIPAVTRLYRAPESEISLYMEAEVPETAEVVTPETISFTANDAEYTLSLAGAEYSLDGSWQIVSADAEPELHKFTVKGEEVTDPEAVQSHIDSLEQFASEQRTSGRATLVRKLVSENRLPAPQQDAMIEFVQTLDDNQFVKWSETMSDAAPIATFGGMGGGGSETDRENNESQIQLAIAEETVRNHRLAGLDEEVIRETDSYKTMIKLQQEDK